MEDHNWRLGAKVVAIVDIIIFCVSLICVGMLTIIYITLCFLVQSEKSEKGVGFKNWDSDLSEETLRPTGQSSSLDFQAINALFKILNSTNPRFFISLLVICSSIRLYAAILLLRSTNTKEIKTSPSKCLRKARVWRNVTILFLFFEIIIAFLTDYYFYITALIAFKLVFVMLVSAFMNELSDLL